MRAATASAPGKVVLCGEYAVLHGYPAVAAAVDRRAIVSVTRHEQGGLVVQTRGYRDGRRRLLERADGALVAADDAGGEASPGLFERAWSTLRPGADTGWSVTLDTAAFSHADGRKFGLGSSAALAVALTAALTGTARAAKVLPLALELHRGFQGSGSGVDVACAVHGGLVRYRMGDAAPAPLRLPPALSCAILWSGRPAATGDRLARLADGLKRRPGRASLDALGERAANVAARWTDGDVSALLDALSGFAAQLAAFDADLGLDIFGGGHRALYAAAADAGVVYKPCGAGGGDVGAVFADGSRRVERFAAFAAGRGFTVLDVALGADGLRLTPTSTATDVSHV